MKRRTVVGTAIATVLVVGFGSRSDTVPAAGTGSRQAVQLLRVGCPNAVPNLDPARAGGSCPSFLESLGLETLMKVSSDGSSVKPHLAQSVRQPGSSTYVYTLRKGVRFWNGNELTAADVANAINYYRYPKFGVSNAYVSVKDVKATGRYTVVVTLKRRDASWKWVSAFSKIFEKKFADEHKGTMGQPGVLIMGTGPWQFDSLNPTTGAELSANPNYWGGRVNTRRISVKWIPDETNAALAMRAGEIDVYWPVSGARAFDAASGPSVDIVSAPSDAMGFIALNASVAPWSDVHVRRAVAYAINRADLTKVLGSPARTASTVITFGQLRTIASAAQINTLVKSLNTYPFNLRRARQELAQSEHPNGFSATINTTSGFGGYATITQAIAGQLRRIGINLQVNDVPVGQYFSEFVGPKDNPRMAFQYADIGGNPDPDRFPRFFLYSKNAPAGECCNLANYRKPAVDALIVAGRAASDPAKRFAIYSQLLRIVARDVPYVPTHNPSVNVAISNRFTWSTFHPQSTFGSPAWALGVKPR